jgi:ABC-type lipoprotein export system ATPase subunit
MISPHNDVVVQLTSVCKSFGQAAVVVHALRDVSFTLRRGERAALLGKSGSGKSTLLNLIGGLDRPTSGEISVAGSLLSSMKPARIADYRRDTVGMIFQSYNLVASWTALQNVELPLIFSGRSVPKRREMARSALCAVGLEKRIDHRPTELSGGEQQRVSIARALMNQPSLLLADEPTGNLDSNTAAEIVELLSTHIRQRGTTTILVTHDEELANRFADRVLHMKDGRLDMDRQGRRGEGEGGNAAG